MSDANKLAWKGTPGPWYARNTSTSILVKHENEIICWLDDWYNEKSTVNAHMISAAPEAVEFIADFLENIDKNFTLEGLKQTMYDRAEEIIKKAYNF